MGWISEDGRHEGYLVPCFPDGQRGIAVTGGHIPEDHVAVEGMPNEPEPGDELGHRRRSRLPWPAWRTRPAADVTGWQVMCTCTRENRPPSTWLGPVIARAASPAEEHLELDVAFLTRTGHETGEELAEVDQLRLYATDQEVDVVVDRGEVESLSSALWLWLHAGVVDQLEPVRRAAREVRTAEQHLAEAVSAARRTGINPEHIHQAIVEAGLSSPTPPAGC